MRDYDEITSFLGEWGPFQQSIFILLSLSTVPNGYAGMSMVFLAGTPHHHCSLPYLNGSTTNLSEALPMEEVNGHLDQSRCTRYKWLNSTGKPFGNETESCMDGWDYSTEQYVSTIVTEWNLVCGDSWKAPFSLSVFFMGVLTGSFISGQISDRFGRKVVLFITMAMQTIFSLLQLASVSWEMFCILFFIVGIGQISNYVAAFVLGTELLGKSSRVTFSTLGVCVFYALGYALLPFCAYFIRSWRMLLFVLTLPGVLYIPLWWLIPESPRWLLAQGRIKEAEAIVQAAAKKNGVTPPQVIFSGLDSAKLMHSDTHNTNTSYSYLDLIRTSKMRNITILNVILWFMVTISYFGLSLNTPNMNGDPYLNCLLSALMEVAAYFWAWLMLKVTSRRAVISSTLLTGGAVLLLTQIVPRDLNILSIVLVMIGKFGITAAFSVMYISAMELFPTVVRGMGVSICSMASKIGSTISPYFAFIGAYNEALPYIVMGLMTLTVGLLSLLLPETQGIPLPEDLSQTQSLNCCFHRCACCQEQEGMLPEETIH
ncbi:solute carrier family 22 member 4-like isoform X1 [Megalops cyprinoides]|uniref:solute carrier family 22 member 4-like isoform X1 n=1 Tax=Megalops cyprinoides TaxID=118141 RepID=UPI0018647B9C|nr:solute carrier family 22 member 4-like isoform X1 [Megalops cyprinoides]